MNRRFDRLLPMLVAACLAACSQQTLYSKLEEREANEEVALLRDAGIQANKVAREGAYAVTVPDADLSRATQILREQGLPRQGFGSRCSVFKREGFVTTTLQEHELRLCAIAQEISHALMALNGVLDARVVLDVPVRNPLMDKVQPPKASVVVKFRQGADADALKSNVKRVVVHSVDGLHHDNVSVEHSMADAKPVASAQATTTSTFAQGMPWPLALSSGVGLAALCRRAGLVVEQPPQRALGRRTRAGDGQHVCVVDTDTDTGPQRVTERARHGQPGTQPRPSNG